MLLRFALKNLFGAGLRTWLNLAIMAIVFVVIVLMQGLYDGMQGQIERARINEETGRTQYWHKDFEPLDPLSFKDAHASQELVLNKTLYPILAISALAYPRGRLFPLVVKGISPDQDALDFPTHYLKSSENQFKTIIGSRMAKRLKMGVGDLLTVKWRTDKGEVDALDFEIVHVFKTDAPAIDHGIIWVDLSQMQTALAAPNHATYLLSRHVLKEEIGPNWILKREDVLLKSTRDLIASKKGGALFFYLILLFLAGITILDTQLLSIFRRRKEVGLLLALGLTQKQIVGVFTIEGTLLGVCACVLAIILASPLFWYLQTKGIQFMDLDQFGLAGGSAIFPHFSFDLFLSTFCIVIVTTALVSYLPARRIGKLLPTEALRGNWT